MSVMICTMIPNTQHTLILMFSYKLLSLLLWKHYICCILHLNPNRANLLSPSWTHSGVKFGQWWWQLSKSSSSILSNSTINSIPSMPLVIILFTCTIILFCYSMMSKTVTCYLSSFWFHWFFSFCFVFCFLDWFLLLPSLIFFFLLDLDWVTLLVLVS